MVARATEGGRMTDAIYNEGHIDFEDWNFEFSDCIDAKRLTIRVKEAIENSLRDHPSFVFIDEVSADDILVTVTLSAFGDNAPVLKFKLYEALEFEVTKNISRLSEHSRCLDDEGQADARNMIAALRAMIAKIEAKAAELMPGKHAPQLEDKP